MEEKKDPVNESLEAPSVHSLQDEVTVSTSRDEDEVILIDSDDEIDVGGVEEHQVADNSKADDGPNNKAAETAQNGAEESLKAAEESLKAADEPVMSVEVAAADSVSSPVPVTPSGGKKGKKKSSFDPYKKPKKPSNANKPKVFEKNDIVVEAYLKAEIKGPNDTFKTKTTTFNLEEDTKRSKESFHEKDQLVSCRICVVCSRSGRKTSKGSYRTSILSVDDLTGTQDMVRYPSENCFLFKFEHVEEIKAATYKSYQCQMELESPTEEDLKIQEDFRTFWKNLETQIGRAQQFLDNRTEHDETTAMEELTNETLYPTKKELETTLQLEQAALAKEKEEQAKKKKEEQARKKKEAASPKAKGGTWNRTKRCGDCEGCRSEDCNECTHCLDMRRNGGEGKLKRPCVLRSCVNITYKKNSMNNLETVHAVLAKHREEETKAEKKKTPSKKKETPSKGRETLSSKKTAKKPATTSKKAAATSNPKKKAASSSSNKQKLPRKLSLSSSDEEGGPTESTPAPSKKRKPSAGQSKSKKSEKEKLPQLVSKGKKLKVGFNFKTKKSKPARSEEEEGDDSDDSLFLADLTLPEEISPGAQAKRDAAHEEFKKDFAEFSRKVDQLKEMDRKREEEKRRRAEEDAREKTGIDARWPVQPEEYLDWVRSEEGVSFFRSIVSEERDESDPFMVRHNHLVQYPHSQLHGKHLDDVKAMSRLDFLDDEDGYWEDEIKKVLREKVMGPAGPPPSIASEFEPGDKWALGPEGTLTPYGLKYFMYGIYQEGFIKFLMDKFGVEDYKVAQEQMLKSRYTQKELEWVDKVALSCIQREKERKEREEQEAKEQAAREYEEKCKVWDTMGLPDPNDDLSDEEEAQPQKPLPSPPASKKRKLSGEQSNKKSSKKQKK